MRRLPAKSYTDLELVGTVRALEPWWRLLTDGFDGYGDRPGVVPGSAEADALLARGDRAEIEAVVDACLDLFTATGRELAAAGAYRRAEGGVHGLFASDGGVPKTEVPEVTIDERGVVGDRQRSLRHHGRPWQALCLWSLETVERLAAEGHPIAPGCAGENVSVTGIDWATVRPGMRLGIGEDVVVELAPWSLPCSKNAQWFTDGDVNRMHHERAPGASRIYASVLRGGRVRRGDPVVVEPDLG